MALYLQTTTGSSAPPVVVAVAAKTDRQTANYHPSIWGDKFLAYTNSSALVKTDEEEYHKMLKQEVLKKLLVTDKSQQELMNLIDDIQRLGVDYHFEVEIDALLRRINDSFQEYCKSKNEYDLHDIALSFRLLRQQGHNVSSDVFNKFKDSNGKFKEYLVKDVRGMLSFYEASYLRVHGEDILDKALEFTTTHLNHHLKNSHLSKPLELQIVRALKCPIRKSLTRLEARHYISIYHQFDKYNHVLLEFAKHDFNLVQKLHQVELGHISRWWKDLDFATKLPFARDRVVECFFWILGVYFEPRYAMARRFVTKVISLTSVIDDMFDVYGTLEELVLFTAAIERWDMSALDGLPEYMKDCYKALLNVFTQMEEEMAEAGKATHGFEYAKAAFKRLTRAYMKEAVWLNKRYVPGLEEHSSVSLVSAGYMMLSAASFVLMGDVATIEAFDWLSQDPLIVRASSLINRFTDDIVGHEEEQKRPHVASGIECYMKEHEVTKEIAYEQFEKDITNAWNDINMECLLPTAVPMPLLTRVSNLARVINLLYDGEDGYKNSSTRTKDFITSVLVDPVPAPVPVL